MEKCKVSVIGRFGFGKNLLNGQTIKTKILLSALEEALPGERFHLVDSYGGAKVLLRLPFQCFRAAMKSKNVIILPANKGIRVIAPILVTVNRLFRRKLHYVVIGGWLNELLKGKPILTWCLKRFDGIYVETSSMKKKLEAEGFRNVIHMPNFKKLPIGMLPAPESGRDSVCRLCTFSRVMKEKGIGAAAEAVKTVNARQNSTEYHLDIYGQVEPGQTEWFESLRQTFPHTVRYCGEVAYDSSVETLRGYDALLFPTEFYTEGIPGTIIDAYAAGVPVIGAMWENYADILDEETGIGYSFGDPEGLEKILLALAEDRSPLEKRRPACLRRAADFTPEAVMPLLVSRLA